MPTPRAWQKWLILAAALLLISTACAQPPGGSEELRKEVQGLKAEVQALKEKLAQVEARQQTMLDLLKHPGAAPEAAAPPAPPGGPATLTVSQLLTEKDRYLGARVTVKGEAGPVLMHHKSLMLKAPEGMVEVSLAALPDQKLVQRLTSAPLDAPLTVTGVVALPPKVGGAKLQITAEAVEF
jgi:hypothetical protein